MRVIASDTLQAKALIQLCDEYEWDKVGVIYIADAYGEGLREAIGKEALAHDIEIQSWAYDGDNGTDSMENAAKFIKDKQLHINILIVHDVHIQRFFATLNQHNLVGYPYFYIGTDSWFIEAEINANHVMDYVQGYIGTIPGSLPMLTKQQYQDLFKSEADMRIYKRAMDINQRIANLTKEVYGIFNHHSLLNFGYDAMYAAAFALDIFNKYHTDSLLNMFNNCSDVSIWNLEALIDKLKPVRDIFRGILINNVSFPGATGPVSFDENGDRDGGLFVYGYIGRDKTMKIFGAFAKENYFIDKESHEWPPGFHPQDIFDDHSWYATNIGMFVFVSVIIIIICVGAMAFVLCIKAGVIKNLKHLFAKECVDDSEEHAYTVTRNEDRNDHQDNIGHLEIEMKYGEEEEKEENVSVPDTVTATDSKETQTNSSSQDSSAVQFSHGDSNEINDVIRRDIGGIGYCE